MNNDKLIPEHCQKVEKRSNNGRTDRQINEKKQLQCKEIKHDKLSLSTVRRWKREVIMHGQTDSVFLRQLLLKKSKHFVLDRIFCTKLNISLYEKRHFMQKL